MTDASWSHVAHLIGSLLAISIGVADHWWPGTGGWGVGYDLLLVGLGLSGLGLQSIGLVPSGVRQVVGTLFAQEHA